MDGKTETLELTGVDAPELATDHHEAECYGEEASAHIKTLVEKQQTVYLEADDEDRNDDDNLLRYVWVPGKKRLTNRFSSVFLEALANYSRAADDILGWLDSLQPDLISHALAKMRRANELIGEASTMLDELLAVRGVDYDATPDRRILRSVTGWLLASPWCVWERGQPGHHREMPRSDL